MFLKKRLARFYKLALQEKGESVKFYVQDMESYIQQKQDEVSEYKNYLNQSHNRLVQEKIQEFENIKELYDELNRVLLLYSKCYFEIHLVEKKKQGVFIEQKLCNGRQNIISEFYQNYREMLDECKELIKIIENTKDDTLYNYLILYHNQDLMGIEPEQIEERAKKVKYSELQKIMRENIKDETMKNAFFSAKTVEEELNLYRKELEQLKAIKKQLYDKINDCKVGQEQIKRVYNVLKQHMEKLKVQQQGLKEKQQQLFKKAKEIWRDYISNSKLCKEYGEQIYQNRYEIGILQREIDNKKEEIARKKTQLENIKSAQSDIKEKRDTLIEKNKFEGRLIQGCIAEKKKILEQKNTYYGVAERAHERRKKLCYEHKCLARVVSDITRFHTYDPGFNDKIYKLKNLSYYIDKASAENDEFMGYVQTCKRELDEQQKYIDIYQANQDRRNYDIERYKMELDSLSEDYGMVYENIKLLNEEIDHIKGDMTSYYDTISDIREEKKAYIDSQYNKFKELTRICQNLLEG